MEGERDPIFIYYFSIISIKHKWLETEIFLFLFLLYLEDLFDYENICDERKVELAMYKLREYALCW